MKREIKFRAWDGKKMWGLDEINLCSVPTLGTVQMKESPDIVIWEKDCPFMQFTGLKDKNGKEIYEGDVCSAPEKDGRVYKIKWNDSDFRWDAISGNGYPRVFSDLNNGEIIGNIYENPYLLT